MHDMGIWNAPPSPKRPHGACAGGQVPDFLAQRRHDNTLPPAHFDLLARRGARIPRRASLPTQEGKEQPWS